MCLSAMNTGLLSKGTKSQYILDVQQAIYDKRGSLVCFFWIILKCCYCACIAQKKPHTLVFVVSILRLSVTYHQKAFLEIAGRNHVAGYSKTHNFI